MEHIRKLSVEAWISMCQEGIFTAVRIPLAGTSMYPLVRINRDYVTIVPLKRALKKGDIVLFLRQDGAYVVHRVRRCSGENVQTLGDNCRYPDAWIAQKDVYGLITRVERGKLCLQVDTPFWRGLGRIWMALLPARTVGYGTLRWIYRRGKRIFYGKGK